MPDIGVRGKEAAKQISIGWDVIMDTSDRYKK